RIWRKSCPAKRLAATQEACAPMSAGCWPFCCSAEQSGTQIADVAALFFSCSRGTPIMARVIWKGAINFGLVHVPIVLHPATRVTRLDFDWIDKRDNSPVGYQRINKRTGKPIEGEHIVKGYEYEKGDYVFLNDEDFKRANAAATQSIDVLSFVQSSEVPLFYFDTPYYLAPDTRGDTGYGLVGDVLRKSGLLALASRVPHPRRSLPALLPLDAVLMLVAMRCADEIRDSGELDLPQGKD